jgi:hypothetical protein
MNKPNFLTIGFFNILYRGTKALLQDPNNESNINNLYSFIQLSIIQDGKYHKVDSQRTHIDILGDKFFRIWECYKKDPCYCNLVRLCGCIVKQRDKFARETTGEEFYNNPYDP